MPRARTAFVPGSETSEQAAEAIEGKAPTLRQRVYSYLERRGRRGATDEEMQDNLHLNPSTQRPRRVELVEGGMVVDSGEKRPTKSKRKAVVWVCAKYAGAPGETLRLF